MLTKQLPSATPRLMVLAVVVLVHILLLYLLLFFPRFQGGSSCMRSSRAHEAVLPHQHNLQVSFPQLIKRGRPVTPQPSASLVGMSRHLTDNSAREASTGSKDLVKDLVNHWQLDVLPVAWSACSAVHFQPASLPAAATGVFGALLSGGLALGPSQRPCVALLRGSFARLPCSCRLGQHVQRPAQQWLMQRRLSLWAVLWMFVWALRCRPSLCVSGCITLESRTSPSVSVVWCAARWACPSRN